MMKQRTIGILGGMGPAASASLLIRILQYARDVYDAAQDSEFPPIILRSIALEGFDETAVMDEHRTKAELIAGVKALEAAGADFIVIPCNTVHYFHSAMQRSVSIPVFNLIEETVKIVAGHDYSAVGLLCSQTTNDTGLYQSVAHQYGITAILPTHDQQRAINCIVWRVIANTYNAHDAAILKQISMSLTTQGAQALILGCTELPFVLQQTDIDLHVFDTLHILTESAVELARSHVCSD